MLNLDHPAVQSGILPLALAFGLAGAIRLAAGPTLGPRVAAASVGLAFLAALIAILGPPPWPALTGLQKLAYLSLAGLLAGVLCDLLGAGTSCVRAAGLLGLGGAYAWLIWPQRENIDAGPGVELALLFAASAWVLWRLAGGRTQGLNPAATVFAAAVGLAGVVLASASLVIAQLGVALGVAVAGYALWNWPVPRYPFAAAGVLGGALPLLTLAALTMLLTQAPLWALAPLLLCFFADALALRLPAGKGRLAQALRPLYVLLLAALPAAAAVALALWTSADPGGDIYYQ